MNRVDAYRILPKNDRLRRSWQAEWPGCQHAPRAWTERGVYRKANRWWLWHRDKSKLRRLSSWLNLAGKR